MDAPAIALDRLTKRYGTRRGIVDLSLEVTQGEILGFIGPNGAGKSTTIRILLGVIGATSGEARIFGQTVTLSVRDLKADIGYLPGEVRYYGDMTVRELLRYSAGFYRGRPLADMAELAERLELDLDVRIDRLSLGNRKKVGIVQALLHRPRLLVLDEPTSGLDPLMQERFFDLLREWNGQGTTIFFSSHVLAEVERLCRRVAILKEGRLVAVEDVAGLRARSVKRVGVEWRRPEAAWVPDGARNVTRGGGRVSFVYQGEVPDLLEQLGTRAADVADVTIEQPSLEEVFLHFYGEGPG